MSDINNDTNEISSERIESQNGGRKETRILKYTETIDKLVIQNKQLQRDLAESENKIDGLQDRLEESNVRISKNLFYVGLLVIIYLIYSGNSHLNSVQNQLVEMNVVLKEYKAEIEKTKLYNSLLEKKLNITPDNKKGGQ